MGPWDSPRQNPGENTGSGGSDELVRGKLEFTANISMTAAEFMA